MSATCTRCDDSHEILETFHHGETEVKEVVPCRDCPRCARCLRRISENVTVPLKDWATGKLWCDSDGLCAWLALRVHVDLTTMNALRLVLRVRDTYNEAPDPDGKWRFDNVTGLDDLVLWVLQQITIEERAARANSRGRNEG